MISASSQSLRLKDVWRTAGAEALGQMADSLPIPLLFMGQDGAAVANAAARTLFGIPPGASSHAVIATVRAAGLLLRPENHEVRDRGGRDLLIGDRCFSVSATPVSSAGRSGSVWCVLDVTSRRAAEQERAQAKRIAVMAQTSVSLGHDLNNLLARIICRAEDLQGPSMSPQTHAVAEALILDVEAAADLVRRQATCGDTSPARIEALDLRPLVVDWQNTRLQAGPERLVETVEGRAMIDADLLRVVLDELAKNAEQAGATRIVVSQRPSPAKDAVTIQIDDDGPGMSVDALARSQASFFTTRPSGAGLGLTMARRVMGLFGGGLALSSSPGKGLTVVLHFRRADSGVTA